MDMQAEQALQAIESESPHDGVAIETQGQTTSRDRNIDSSDESALALIKDIVGSVSQFRDNVRKRKDYFRTQHTSLKFFALLVGEMGNFVANFFAGDSEQITDPKILKDHHDVCNLIVTEFPEILSKQSKKTGKTLLHQACHRMNSGRGIESLQLMLERHPNGAATKDLQGAIPLHYACLNGEANVNMLQCLVKANPGGVSTADAKGCYPLHWAVYQREPSIDIIRYLIEEYPGAVTARSKYGSLPMHQCLESPHETLTEAVVKQLVAIDETSLRTPTQEGYLPLHVLASADAIPVSLFEYILNLYPQAASVTTGEGCTPLHLALDNKIPNFEVVQLLLAADAKAAKVTDIHGQLPLHVALDCDVPNEDIVATLLRSFPEGASVASSDGLLALHYVVAMHSNPSSSLIQQLVDIYPLGVQYSVKQKIPRKRSSGSSDVSAEPSGRKGEWTVHKWTPLSKAVDRGLKTVAKLMKETLQKCTASSSSGRGSEANGVTSGERGSQETCAVTAQNGEAEAANAEGDDTPHTGAPAQAWTLTDPAGRDESNRASDSGHVIDISELDPPVSARPHLDPLAPEIKQHVAETLSRKGDMDDSDAAHFKSEGVQSKRSHFSFGNYRDAIGFDLTGTKSSIERELSGLVEMQQSPMVKDICYTGKRGKRKKR